MANNPYCSIADLNALFDLRQLGMLSNDTNSEVMLQTRVQSILDMAASELETTLSGRVPIPPVDVNGNLPPFLKKIVSDIAIDYLYGRRADKPKEVRANVDMARDWLKLFRENAVQIPNVPSWAPVAVPPCESVTLQTNPLPVPTLIIVSPPVGTFGP